MTCPHVYETYEGDHVDGIARRLETKVFAFFSGAPAVLARPIHGC